MTVIYEHFRKSELMAGLTSAGCEVVAKSLADAIIAAGWIAPGAITKAVSDALYVSSMADFQEALKVVMRPYREWVFGGSGPSRDQLRCDLMVATPSEGRTVISEPFVTGLTYEQANAIVVEHNYPFMTIKRGDETAVRLNDGRLGGYASARKAVTGAGHEPDYNPTTWLRHISTIADISNEEVWTVVFLQAVERLREMRHGVIHSPAERPILMMLRIELR